MTGMKKNSCKDPDKYKRTVREENKLKFNQELRRLRITLRNMNN
jgi:hypothetical protein